MKDRLLVPLLMGLGLMLSSCGDDAPSQPNPPDDELAVTRRIDAAGGTIVLEGADGTHFELRIPAAALDDETEITVRRVPPAEWPPEVQANPPVGGAVFELLPEGTLFNAPVTTYTRVGAASLGSGTRTTLPGHVSRTSAGSIERHPTSVHRRGSDAVILARTQHFSTHWVGTDHGDGAEYGVNLVWPTNDVPVEGVASPNEFSVWTSSVDEPQVRVSVGAFAAAPPDGTQVQVLRPIPFELGDDALDSALEEELRTLLAVVESEDTPASDSTMLDLDVTLAPEEGYTFDPDLEWPRFGCQAEGKGRGWVVVQLITAREAPITYIEEVETNCITILIE